MGIIQRSPLQAAENGLPFVNASQHPEEFCRNIASPVNPAAREALPSGRTGGESAGCCGSKEPRKKKAAAWTGILLGFLLVMMTPSAYGFRCGTRLISIGDRPIDVRKHCGKPDAIQAWKEERFLRDFGSTRNGGNRYPNREPFLVKIHVNIEEWTYNLGPHRFIRILRFENGRLVDIATGDRGYLE